VHFGVAPEQRAQLAPQWRSLLQLTHWLLLHQLPDEHWLLVVHMTHCPLTHPFGQGTFVEP
jgi:hypothetical protein